jgi:hypothetical protein
MRETVSSQLTESCAPYVYQLYSMVVDEGSIMALQELSSMAMSGSETPIAGRVRQLVDRIDDAVNAGELTLLPHEEKPSSLIPDCVFLVIHPINYLKSFQATDYRWLRNGRTASRSYY